MTMPVAVGTGLVALDVVLRGADETPVRRSTGGTCGNVLTILRYLGWKAVPVARLAEDRAGRAIEADLTALGVDTRFLRLEPTRPTPIIVQRLVTAANGEPTHRFTWTCPCCGAWLPRYVPVPSRGMGDVLSEVGTPSVFFFDRPSRGALTLAQAYARTGALVVFEPSARGEPALFGAALGVAQIVKYSDQRFATLPTHKPARGGRRLEIQTLGAKGLRYRIATGSRVGAWHALPALHGGRVVDTSGAGDWCTAGLLAQVGVAGAEGFEDVTREEIRQALHYGQALSAWNCEFEGARGGMYERSRREFTTTIEALLRGVADPTETEVADVAHEALSDLCPACPGPAKATKSRRARATHVAAR